MPGRPIFAILSLVLIAGAALLIFLVLLAGAVDGFPVNQIYFLEADTSSIPGANAISRWTLWNICGDSNGNDVSCSKIMAAFPFDPQSNFNSQKNVPAGFIGNNQFYYMSRVVFAFTLIALFFTISALFIGVLALCSRIGSYLSSVTALIALLMQTVTCALMTSCFVMGRNMFNANNQPASLGNEAFGFFWASWLCLLIASVFFCVGGATSSGSGGRFSRGGKRSSRDRGSFAADAETSSFVRS